MLIIAVIVVTVSSFLQKSKEYLGLKELRCNKESDEDKTEGGY